MPAWTPGSTCACAGVAAITLVRPTPTRHTRNDTRIRRIDILLPCDRYKIRSTNGRDSGFGNPKPLTLSLYMHLADTSLIHARGLIKRFGAFTAVDGISFDVHPGEAFGFLGPNGA